MMTLPVRPSRHAYNGADGIDIPLCCEGPLIWRIHRCPHADDITIHMRRGTVYLPCRRRFLYIPTTEETDRLWIRWYPMISDCGIVGPETKKEERIGWINSRWQVLQCLDIGDSTGYANSVTDFRDRVMVANMHLYHSISTLTNGRLNPFANVDSDNFGVCWRAWRSMDI